MSPGPVLLVVSHHGGPAPAFRGLIAGGEVRPVRQTALADEEIETATGLLTTIHLDQIDFHARSAALRRMVARGGRVVFNGHVVRPFLEGLQNFVPLLRPRRPDFDLFGLAPHPVFAGFEMSAFVERRGVAGFYGRGYNPPLPGALPVTGLGPQRLPIDWEWIGPSGGGLFVHAGNDLWSAADGEETGAVLAARLAAWCRGGEEGGLP